MYRRSLIREGDTLAPGGGKVQPKPQLAPVTHYGKNACFEGDPVYCYTCQTWGVTKCVPPYRPHTAPDGRQATLDGDLCLCKCPTPPRLKALCDKVWMGFSKEEIMDNPASEGWLRYSGFSTSPQYDEQVEIISEAGTLAGLPFYIQLPDGRTVKGLVGNDGKLPRIETEGAGFYHLFWGDDALERMDI